MPSRGQSYLESPRLADVARMLNAAVDQLRGGGDATKVALVLDQPDVLLAAAGTGDGVTSASLRELVLDLREVSLPFFLLQLLFMGACRRGNWARAGHAATIPRDGRHQRIYMLGTQGSHKIYRKSTRRFSPCRRTSRWSPRRPRRWRRSTPRSCCRRRTRRRRC